MKDQNFKLEDRYESMAKTLEKKGYSGLDVNPGFSLFEYGFLARKIDLEGQGIEYQIVYCSADIYNGWPWPSDQEIFSFFHIQEYEILEEWEKQKDDILDQFSQESRKKVEKWPSPLKLFELEIFSGYINQLAYGGRWKFSLKDLEEGKPTIYLK